MTTTTRTYTAEEIREKITTDPRWARQAILALYAEQTADEQQTRDTRHRNARGFNSNDAALLSSFAQQIQRGKQLSPKQLTWAYRKLAKYAGQLCRLQNSPSMDPGLRTVPETPKFIQDEDPAEVKDQRVIDLYWKSEYAKREYLEERAAFLSDPDFQPTMAGLDSLALSLIRR